MGKNHTARPGGLGAPCLAPAAIPHCLNNGPQGVPHPRGSSPDGTKPPGREDGSEWRELAHGGFLLAFCAQRVPSRGLGMALQAPRGSKYLPPLERAPGSHDPSPGVPWSAGLRMWPRGQHRGTLPGFR